jgi:hypothetical protein
VRIEGLQIFANMDGPGGGLTFGVDLRGYTTEPATAHLSHNIIKSKPVGSSTSYSRGIKIAPGSGLTAYIWNNIIYGFGDDAAKGYGIEFANGPGGGAAYVYNNTVCSCYAGVVVNTGEMAAKNNVVLQSMREDLGGAAILMGSNNKTGDGSAAQAGLGAQLSSDVPADFFISGSDFHIDPAAKHAAELMDAGLDLSKDSKLPFTTDIEGLTRGAKWDIGASEHAP